ncbi:MAG: hypothetical protein FWB85_04765 [Chitinispirillia bacterium]|nr:hypothetical protein [Chitinispirillia bacterium]MCL2242019.1 hypothetical protein [Chitinispirillia bacterium]
MNADVRGGKRGHGGVRMPLSVLAAAVCCLLIAVAGCGNNGSSGNGGEDGGGDGGDGVEGAFTDTRDGRRYRMVQLGTYVWMAGNLNYAGHTAGNSWCYEDNTSNCEKYGRLYDWNAAMSACPPGWRLPVSVNWTDMVRAAGGGAAGKNLKSKEPEWDGADEYGFSALPGGFRYNIDGGFYGAGTNGSWWDATYGGDNAFRRAMLSGADEVRENNNDKNMGYSVRCIRE